MGNIDQILWRILASPGTKQQYISIHVYSKNMCMVNVWNNIQNKVHIALIYLLSFTRTYLVVNIKSLMYNNIQPQTKGLLQRYEEYFF